MRWMATRRGYRRPVDRSGVEGTSSGPSTVELFTSGLAFRVLSPADRHVDPGPGLTGAPSSDRPITITVKRLLPFRPLLQRRERGGHVTSKAPPRLPVRSAWPYLDHRVVNWLANDQYSGDRQPVEPSANPVPTGAVDLHPPIMRDEFIPHDRPVVRGTDGRGIDGTLRRSQGRRVQAYRTYCLHRTRGD